MLLFIVVFWHGWLRRALPVRLSQVCLLGCLWQTMLTRQTLKNAQLAVNIQHTLSGKWEEFGAAESVDIFFLFLFLLFASGQFEFIPGKDEEMVFFTITPDSSRLMFSWVVEELRLCVNVVRTQQTDQLKQTQYVIFDSLVHWFDSLAASCCQSMYLDLINWLSYLFIFKNRMTSRFFWK